MKAFVQWRLDHPQESRIEEEISDAQERIRQNQAEQLYHFIVQTLEEHGFGFYQSDMLLDDDILDDNDNLE